MNFFAIIYKDIEYIFLYEDKDRVIKLIEEFNGTNKELEKLLESLNIVYIYESSMLKDIVWLSYI